MMDKRYPVLAMVVMEMWAQLEVINIFIQPILMISGVMN